jgi:hypothetical protein
LQQCADLAHQFIASGVTAGIVDDFELIEIKIHHGVVQLTFCGAA